MGLFETRKTAETALEKRRRQVEEDLAKVRHDLKLLTRFVEKPQKPVDLAQLKARLPSETPVGTASVQPRESAVAKRSSMGPPSAAPARLAGGGDPARGPRPAPPEEPGPSPGAPVTPAGSDAFAARNRPLRARDDRLADFLATGIPDLHPPLRHERRVQRNRAIVMIIFVFILLIYAIYAIRRLFA